MRSSFLTQYSSARLQQREREREEGPDKRLGKSGEREEEGNSSISAAEERERESVRQ